MSWALQNEVNGLQKRVTELEVLMSNLLVKFPEGYRAEHKGFKNYYVVDRFSNIVTTSNGDEPFGTKEEAQAEAARMNMEKAA